MTNPEHTGQSKFRFKPEPVVDITGGMPSEDYVRMLRAGEFAGEGELSEGEAMELGNRSREIVAEAMQEATAATGVTIEEYAASRNAASAVAALPPGQEQRNKQCTCDCGSYRDCEIHGIEADLEREAKENDSLRAELAALRKQVAEQEARDLRKLFASGDLLGLRKVPGGWQLTMPFCTQLARSHHWTLESAFVAIDTVMAAQESKAHG